jgi:hypothetical protein
MNSNPHNPSVPVAVSGTISSSAEQTLRLIASLPAPAGLEDRVHAALGTAARSGRILAWPQSDWMRTAAAAVIVFVVAGGGWGIYTHVQHGQPAKVIVMPHAMQPDGFSGAGAKRTPQTLPGPTVILPVKPTPAQHKAKKKPAASLAPSPAASAKAASAAALTAQPDASK